MREINWYAMGGIPRSNPGTVKTMECGVCYAQMNVERNVLSATSYGEVVLGTKSRHDRFLCPNRREDWHEKIIALKQHVYHTEALYVHLKMFSERFPGSGGLGIVLTHYASYGIYHPKMTVEETKAQWEEAKKKAEKEINEILDAHAAR